MFLIYGSQQKFAHVINAVLLWNVYTFVGIILLKFTGEPSKVSIKFELCMKSY